MCLLCSSCFATSVLHLRPCVQCSKILPRSFTDKFSVLLHRLAAWISLVFACLHSSGGYKHSRTLLYITLFLIMQEQYFITNLRTRNTRCSTVYILTHSAFDSQLPRCGNASHWTSPVYRGGGVHAVFHRCRYVYINFQAIISITKFL
jgi:hypothetical protein